MSRKIRKLSHQYQFLELELEEIEEQADDYATQFNKLFGKYFIDKNAEMWVNEETGELRKEPPQENDKKKKVKKDKKLKDLYKKLSRYLHPDKGGTAEKFSELKQAYDENDLLGLVKIAGNNKINIEIKEDDLELAEKSINKLQTNIKNFKNSLAWHYCTGNKRKKLSVLQTVEQELGIKIEENEYPDELK